MVVPGRGAVSYEQDTPVLARGTIRGYPRRETLGSANAMSGLDEQGYLAQIKKTPPRTLQ